MAARSFGPATLGVLLLLLMMVIASVARLEAFILPDFRFEALHSGYLHYTLSGYAQILALMTGMEIFANLVAAYDGTPRQRSRRAFGSLVIIMGTTLGWSSSKSCAARRAAPKMKSVRFTPTSFAACSINSPDRASMRMLNDSRLW